MVVLQRILHGVWPSLPALAVGSAAVCVAALIPAVVVPGVNPIAVLLAALAMAPFLAALAHTVNRIAADGDAQLADWWIGLVRFPLFAVRQALVAAVPAALFLVAWHLWSVTHSLLALPSVGACGAATVVAVAGFGAVLPLGAARPDLRGRQLWISGLFLVGRRPAGFIAAGCLVGLGLWACVGWTASLLVLVPAPAMVVLVAAVWTATTELAGRGPEGAVPDGPVAVAAPGARG